MDDNENKYICLNNFMIRTPLLPYDLYLDACNYKSNALKEFFNNKKVQEAILTGSNSLYNSLIKQNNQTKKVVQAESSLLKYMIRMTTRTTPYGLFSGIGLGNFNESTSINTVDLSSGFKYMRIDMEWEYKLLQTIENDTKILKQLKVYPSNTLLKNGDRLDNIYISNFYENNSKEYKNNASIKYSKNVKIALEESKSGIRVYDLIRILNPDCLFEEEIVFKFIRNLISNEYLITELRPPLVNTNTTEYILSKLSTIPAAKNIFDSLLDISELINLYNQTKVGDGIDIYINIISKMKSLCECKNYLQVDLKKADSFCNLNNKIKSDIEELSNVLVKLSQINKIYDNLNEFALDFVEKYGPHREVNILEVLDVDKGLGLPKGYTSNNNILINNIENNRINYRYNEVLSMKLSKCINDGNNEIILNENDLNYICDNSINALNHEYLPKCFDLNVFFKSKDIHAMDNNDYEIFIGPNFGSSYAGQTLGRFSHMFDDKLKNYFDEIDKSVCKLEDNTILVEISELPINGRIANVSKNYNNRDYELPIATNNSSSTKKIYMQDVFVGVDNKNKFYFKSKSLNKKILFTSNHMLNPKLSSNICRFMREVSDNSNTNIFSGISNIGIKNLNNIPRLKYKNIILSPAKWKLSKHNLQLGNDSSLNLINLKKFIEENKVPRYIYIGTLDNRLVIDTKNEDHLNEMISEVIKNEYNIEITELEFSNDSIWVKDSNNKSYITEFVFSLIYNNKNNDSPIIKNDVLNTISDVSKNKNSINTYSSNRVSGLFNDWIYFKFYGIEKRFDEFLGIELRSFLSELYDSNIVNKYFYLRYCDSRKHIRLRLKLTDRNLMEKFIILMDNFINMQVKKGLISDVSIDTYFKEIERYGGIEPHKKVEQLFCDDSYISISLISLKRNNIIKMDNILIACINIIHILESVGLEFNVQNELFQSLFNKKDDRKLFREKSKELLFYCNSDNDWENLRSCKDGEYIYNIMKKRDNSFNEFWQTVNQQDKNGNLTNTKVDILMSIIHMFCNKFLDSRDEETISMRLVRHTLHALEYKKINLL